MALDLDAERVEIAQVQYYGWALKNRAAFIPTPEQLDHATEIVEKARVDLKGKLVIDYVIPDYYAKHPKNCMGGWGRRFLNMNPKEMFSLVMLQKQYHILSLIMLENEA